MFYAEILLNEDSMKTKCQKQQSSARKYAIAGRRFGKSIYGMFLLMKELPISQQEKKKLFEAYSEIVNSYL